MAIIKGEEFLGGKPAKVIDSASDPLNIPSKEESKSLFERAKSVGTGAVKEIVGGAIDTAQIAQGLGQRTMAALDPTKTLSDIRKETGFESLKGESIKQIDEQLLAKNTDEKIGKVLGFIGTILIPTGKSTAGQRVLGKGKDVVDDVIAKAKDLPDDLVEGGVKVKDRVIDLMTKLDDKTKTALSRTPRDVFDDFVKTGKEAMVDDRVKTPIEKVGEEFVSAAKSIKNRLDQVGKLKSSLLNQAKNGQKDVSDLVKESILKIQKGLTGLGPDDQKYATEIIDRLKPYIKNGRAKDVDALIDDIQDGLYKLSDSEKAVQLTDRVTGLIRSSIEGMNKALQNRIGGAYAKANKDYSSMLKILNDVNRGVGKNGERAGAFMKRFFSPSDAGTKELFEKMTELTNIDFARDARLAKFVMEALGDRRVESLLEQIPKNLPQSSIDALMKLGSFIGKKIGVDDPIEAARRFIEKQGSSLIE